MFDLLKTRETPQIFDLLQLSKKEKEAKTNCLYQIQEFNSWRKMQNPEFDISAKLHAQIEGILLRRQTQNALYLYRSLRKERKKQFENYMNRLVVQKNIFHKVS